MFNSIKPVYLLVLLSASLLFVTSCSTSVRFANSAVVPSAVGTAKLTKDSNKNLLLILNVRNLVDPSRLTPSKKVYLVWMQTKDQGNKNLGRLVSSEAYFSTERNAKFSAVLTAVPTKIFITAEDSADLQNPGSVTVLVTESF